MADTVIFTPGMTYEFPAGLALGFLAWDICITMDDEVQYIWMQRSTSPWMLYLLIRYMPLITAFSIWPTGSTASPNAQYSHTACIIWQTYNVFTGLLTMATLEYILLLRVRALYYRHRLIKITVSILYGIEVLLMLIGTALTIPKYTYDHACAILNTPVTGVVYGAATPIFHTIMFILTNISFWKAVRVEGRGRILVLLMRDGIWAFFVVQGVIVANGIAFMTDPNFLLFDWLQFACSFVGYRLILNLRRGSSTTDELSVPSALVFGTSRPTSRTIAIDVMRDCP